ncbi:hypothetical protein G7046_g2025 [Stylonectria norvegica]|nr:hypothetical protein G7046_g2025 [Stylonectria norvegica]
MGVVAGTLRAFDVQAVDQRPFRVPGVRRGFNVGFERYNDDVNVVLVKREKLSSNSWQQLPRVGSDDQTVLGVSLTCTKHVYLLKSSQLQHQHRNIPPPPPIISFWILAGREKKRSAYRFLKNCSYCVFTADASITGPILERTFQWSLLINVLANTPSSHFQVHKDGKPLTRPSRGRSTAAGVRTEDGADKSPTKDDEMIRKDPLKPAKRLGWRARKRRKYDWTLLDNEREHINTIAEARAVAFYSRYEGSCGHALLVLDANPRVQTTYNHSHKRTRPHLSVKAKYQDGAYFTTPNSDISLDWRPIDLMINAHQVPQATSTLGYPLHVSCWKILDFKCSFSHIPLDIEAMFEICRSQPIKHGLMQWGHDYEGVFETPKDQVLYPGDDVEVSPEAPSAIIHSDPLELPSLLDSFFLAGDNRRLERFSAAQNQRRGHPPGQPRGTINASNSGTFSVLTSDILLQILLYLDCTDVTNLRLSSRIYACFQLPPEFWRSRFWPGRVFEHIFEACGHTHEDRLWAWNDLYNAVKSLNHTDFMANRRRVWCLASRLGTLINIKVHSSLPLGLVSKGRIEPIAEIMSNCVGGDFYYKRERRMFTRGSSVLHESIIQLPMNPRHIQVSFIMLNGKGYVTGLNIIHDKGHCAIGYVSRLRDADVQLYLQTKPKDVINHLRVAVDARGIRGVSTMLSSGLVSPWIGESHKLHRQVLWFSRNPQRYLHAGFDALKIVFLRSMNPEQTDTRRNSWVATSRWYPDTPPPSFTFYCPQPRMKLPYNPRLPFTIFLFGGITGAFLPYLTDVEICTAVENEYRTLNNGPYIWGLRFHYTGPIASKGVGCFGRDPPARLQRQTYRFALRGARIIHFDTKYGRRREFAHDKLPPKD